MWHLRLMNVALHSELLVVSCTAQEATQCHLEENLQLQYEVQLQITLQVTQCQLTKALATVLLQFGNIGSSGLQP